MKEDHKRGLNLYIQTEDTGHYAQLQIVYEFLQKNVATASMVAQATGVPQKCIAFYKRDLEFAGKLWEIEKKKCQITRPQAFYLTTDPEKAPKQSTSETTSFIQLSLFP